VPLCRVDHAQRPDRLEHLQHVAILGEQQGGEADDALGPSAFGEQVEQRRADAAPLPLVDHGDGRLGRVRAVGAADEARDADAVAGNRVDRGERLVVVVVDVGQVGHDIVRELRHRRQEALVARLRAEPLKAGQQQLAVVRAHRAHEHPGAVAQGDGDPGVGFGGHDS